MGADLRDPVVRETVVVDDDHGLRDGCGVERSVGR
jgi:hypothetical protein